jgi:hypothetical protein
LALDTLIFAAGMRLERQAAVSPQLPLDAKPMRRLDQRDEQSGANGADRGNLAQQFYRAVFPAFGQQIPSHLLAQCLERVELLIAELRPAKCAGFGD